MPSQASQQDWDAFVAAAQQSQFAGRVDISREVQKRLRTWAVDNSLCQPGVAIPAEGYSAIIAQFIGAGSNLQRTKTAEEIAAEAQAAADLEARRNMGVVFRKNEPDKPTHVINEFAERDAVKEHNDQVDAAFARKRNPVAERMQQMENLLARTDTTQQIPGLKDESWSGNEVYIGGRVAHYKTQCAVAAAKEHNAQVRAKYAEQQAVATEAAATQKRGI